MALALPLFDTTKNSSSSLNPSPACSPLCFDFHHGIRLNPFASTHKAVRKKLNTERGGSSAALDTAVELCGQANRFIRAATGCLKKPNGTRFHWVVFPKLFWKHDDGR